MQQTALYERPTTLCPEGRGFIADRGLSPVVAEKYFVTSKDGYIYFGYLRDGEVVRWKRRSIINKKDQISNHLPEEEAKTFKYPFFCQYKDPTIDYLIITEGEFDCIALRQLGAVNVVSLPNGASSMEKSIKDNIEFIQKFKTIYICTDMDEAGKTAADKALALLGPAKYRRLNLPCKDANDWIRENPEVELVDLQYYMENATKIPTPFIKKISEVNESFFAARDLGISTGWYKLDAILGGIRLGELTVVSADTGSGKSTFCMNLVKNITDQGKGVWVNSYEMDSDSSQIC